jgi:hypothetical protein
MMYQDTSQVNQVFLKNFYRSLRDDCARLPSIRDVGFSVYSQHDEDGILLYLFALLGEGSKSFIEIGCCGPADRLENNCANLAINHAWTGLMIDANSEGLAVVDGLLNSHKNLNSWPVKLATCAVTSVNINGLLEENNYLQDVDLFSLDIDSIDYHVIKALKIRPRILVVETPPIWGPGIAKSVPDNVAYNARANPNFYGASLEAFSRLLKTRHYHLVAVNKLTTNAFFLRDDCAHPCLPELAVADCFTHPRALEHIQTRHLDTVHQPWEDV